MDTRWLEDFIALRESGNFTRAAERRYVTQPAFSRRIRALEDWFGVELVDRSSYPARLTGLAEEYVPRMEALMQALDALRSDLREEFGRRDTLIVSTQASLSSAFIPTLSGLLGKHSSVLSTTRLRIVAGNLYDCLDDFLSARSDLLLCYDFRDMNPLLERNDLERITLSTDRLLPVALSPEDCIDDKSGSVDYVAFPEESFFGDLILRETSAFFEASQWELTHRIETSHAESVRELVKRGLGMSWLPERLIADELASGALTTITCMPSIDVEIHGIRHRSSKSSFVDAAWEALTRRE